MKRVALINPGRNEQFAVQEPLNLGFIAAYLEKNGVEVRIIDELAGEDVPAEISRYGPDVAGITATTPLAEDAYRIADHCKKAGILTVMGGVHASVLPEEALSHSDIVVIGEGEQAMLDIASGSVNPGIVRRDYIRDLDEIPMPARHLMKMDFYTRTKDRLPHTYLHFVPPRTKTSAMLTSRGCPYTCTFCHNTWKGMPYRLNSAERVLEEIELLMREYGVEAVFFIEDTFFGNKQRLMKICDMIKSRGIKLLWGCNSRVNELDLDSLKAVKAAGCRQITIGFESGSQRILDALNKRTTVEQNSKAVQMCKEAGLYVNGTFMVGSPTETARDVEETAEFIRRNPIDSIGICITTPYPGTAIWNWCKKNNLIPAGLRWSDFVYDRISVPCSTTMTASEIEAHADNLRWLVRVKTGDYFSGFLAQYLRSPRKLLRALLRLGKSPSYKIKFAASMLRWAAGRLLSSLGFKS